MRNSEPRPAVWAIPWLAVLVSFVGLAIRAGQGSVLPLDVTLARAVQDLPSFLEPIFHVTNWTGDGVPLATVTIISAAALQASHCTRGALLMLSMFLARSGDVVVKHVVAEPRPSPALIHVEWPFDRLSFPSGHVVGVTLVFGLLLILVPRLCIPNLIKTVTRAIAILFIGTVGLGRIFVGAHWPTDVLGGYLYAALFLIPVLAWHRTRAS